MASTQHPMPTRPPAPVTGIFPLSPQDNIFFAAHDMFEGLGLGAFVIRLRGMVEEPLLRAALARLQQRHPRLRARIRMDGDRRSWDILAEPPPIPLRIKDYGPEPMPWHEEAYADICEKMDVSVGPMARVLVLRSREQGVCEMIFSLHHGVADGASAVRIMDDVLCFYAELEQGGEPAPVVSLPLVSISHAQPSGRLARRILAVLKIGLQRIHKRRGNWIDLPAAPEGSTHPHVERVTFTEQESAAIQQNCMAERTTVGGALYAAAVSGLADMVPDRSFRYRFRMPINIRHTLIGPDGPVTSNDVGCFVSRYEMLYAVHKPCSFWELARQIWRDMETYVTSGGPQLYYNIAGLIRVKKLRLLGKRDTMMVNYFRVARLRGQFGSLRVEEFMTIARGDQFGPALNVWGVTLGNRLCVWVAAQSVPREFWAGYRDAVFKHLRAAMEPRHA